MQNRYVGDVGDFGKYGLLRVLSKTDISQPSDRALRLGIVWYLHLDESHNADGKYIGYLASTQQFRAVFRKCDPELYDSLQKLVASGDRDVANVRRIGIFPSNTDYYEPSLSFSRNQSRSSRKATRMEWISELLRLPRIQR